MKRKILSIICMALILSMTLVSCGDGSSSSEGSKESALSQDGSSSESFLTAEDEASEEEKPFYLKTYEVVKGENWTDLRLFTPDSIKSLEAVEPETFTYETLCDIVNDTIELYEKYDYIAVNMKEGYRLISYILNNMDVSPSTEVRCKNDILNQTLGYEAHDTILYFISVGQNYVNEAGEALRMTDDSKIVFKTGKPKEEMENIDKIILREIIFLRLLYVTNSGCVHSYKGEENQLTYIYLSDEWHEMNETTSCVKISYCQEFTFFDAKEPTEQKNLLPEWLGK